MEYIKAKQVINYACFKISIVTLDAKGVSVFSLFKSEESNTTLHACNYLRLKKRRNITKINRSCEHQVSPYC